ncbi:MAG: tRNA (guanosine(46)-N7)-methyltransferase TrmB [Candidatus Dadabacteria bacterium]
MNTVVTRSYIIPNVNMNTSPPVLDITEYYLPLNLSLVFGNQTESALEIGSGDGDFLIEMARRKADWNFIGIEIKGKRFRKAVRRAEGEKIRNVKFLVMDAQIAIEEVFPSNTFIEVYINFPDPWPKEKHKKHRIINTDFIEKLSLIMKPEGVLEVASDHKEYISYILDVLDKMSMFRCAFPSPGYVSGLTNRPHTKYEMEFREKGKEIYYLRFVRTP